MFKKCLIFVLCALTFGSCEFRHILSEEELNDLDKAILDFDLDWSNLDEEPSGCTFYFYPCDENPIDTTIFHYSYNTVNHVRVYLPEQDYAVICFNRSESEFADYNFDLSSFEGAKIWAKSSDEVSNATVRYSTNGTRAYSASGQLRPKSFGSSSISSVKSQTRAYSASGRLRPKPPVKGMSMKVHAFGLNESVRVSGRLSNLSAGVTLHNQEPLAECLNQSLDADCWTMHLPTDNNTPGSVTCSFGTFGVSGASGSATRAEGDTGSEIRNILELVFKLPDGDSVVFQQDVTEEVRSEFNRILEEERENENNPSQEPNPEHKDMEVIIGKSDDKGGSNSSENDAITQSGTIVLHKTNAGTNVKVTNWEEHVIEIIL